MIGFAKFFMADSVLKDMLERIPVDKDYFLW